MHAPVQVGTEHDVTYVIQQHYTEQAVVAVDDRKEITVGLRDDFYHLAQIHLGMYRYEVRLYHIVDFKESEHRLVLMVREQLATLRQTHGVDAVRLEKFDGEVG